MGAKNLSHHLGEVFFFFFFFFFQHMLKQALNLKCHGSDQTANILIWNFDKFWLNTTTLRKRPLSLSLSLQYVRNKFARNIFEPEKWLPWAFHCHSRNKKMFWASVAHGESHLLLKILHCIFHTLSLFICVFPHSDSSVRMITVALWWQESHLTWPDLHAYICRRFAVLRRRLQVPLWGKHRRGRVLISSSSHTGSQGWTR